MVRFVGTEKLMLLGVLLFGATSLTVSVAQPVPMEVALQQSAVSAKADSVEQSIAAILLRCDKCDASVKKEIIDAKKEAAGLKQSLRELREITDGKFVATTKACK